ncbi:hypothetical protein NGRA_2113 [Nosema granulosis]|uniref:Uncharacterized protein n=1 Tax=Nosema granulosis TaxID=83296 RepID=A0A9P6GXL6_9MICR|nr:hypothetical protein NGRA_2113 [Nosema granulosis]
MSVFGYIKKILGNRENVVKKVPGCVLNKFPISKGLYKASSTKLDTQKILLDCLSDFLISLSSQENRMKLFPKLYKNYSETDKTIEKVILTMKNDFFIKENGFKDIVDGRSVLDGSYSDLSIFFFNVYVYGHPLLLETSQKNKNLEDDFLNIYSDYLVEIDFKTDKYKATLREHIISTFNLILKVIFL